EENVIFADCSSSDIKVEGTWSFIVRIRRETIKTPTFPRNCVAGHHVGLEAGRQSQTPPPLNLLMQREKPTVNTDHAVSIHNSPPAQHGGVIELDVRVRVQLRIEHQDSETSRTSPLYDLIGQGVLGAGMVTVSDHNVPAKADVLSLSQTVTSRVLWAGRSETAS
ncbi:hypothetical protein BaRGS_00022111, partial [Batillaria attramentaria]